MDRYIGSRKTRHLFNIVLFKIVEIRMVFIIFSILQNFQFCQNFHEFRGECTPQGGEGYAQMTYADGSVYTGNWSRGARSGYGRMIYKDHTDQQGRIEKEVFRGDWSEDQCRKGTLILEKDGVQIRKYEGEFFGGKYHGHGTFSCAAITLSTEFANGLMAESAFMKKDPHLFIPEEIVDSDD